MSETDDLIERLTKATGPDHNLDADIDILVRPGIRVGCPEYTRSLDAAMTLLPEGYIWDVFSDWPGDVYWAEIESDNWLPGGKVPTFRGECAATPAIALLIAIMKARKGE